MSLSTVAHVVLVCALYFRMSLFSICFAFIDEHKMSWKIHGKVVFNKEADEAKLQFEEFATNYVPRHSDKFNSFNVSMQRLDKFYGKFLHKNQQYKSI